MTVSLAKNAVFMARFLSAMPGRAVTMSLLCLHVTSSVGMGRRVISTT